jgi:flagellar basal-body rod protein FlgB
MDLTLLRLSSSLAAHAMARQTVVTENIAHADTPGYRARDLPDFAETMTASPGFIARATRPGHAQFDAGADRFQVEEIAILGAEAPNGNSVSLEDQMIRAAELRQSHDLALGVYGKTMDILRSSIGKQR